jgi:hypothetical protein
MDLYLQILKSHRLGIQTQQTQISTHAHHTQRHALLSIQLLLVTWLFFGPVDPPELTQLMNQTARQTPTHADKPAFSIPSAILETLALKSNHSHC